MLHVGARSEALLPRDEAVRARATSWLIAALNSIEVVVQQLVELDLSMPTRPGRGTAGPTWSGRRGRLADLADRAFLEDRFTTAGDLMMASVLRSLRHTDLVEGHPTLSAYLARCEAAAPTPNATIWPRSRRTDAISDGARRRSEDRMEVRAPFAA